MFSPSRLRTAGVVVASVALLTAGAQSCPANCKKAAQYDDGSMMCLECQDGYWFANNEDFSCVKLPENFVYSDFDEVWKGWECKVGYYLDPKDNLKCIPCDYKSKYCRCSASDPGKCIVCDDGFGFNEDETDCKPCTVEHCKSCNQNYGVCTRCEDGYVLNANEKCVKCRPENCLSCSASDPSVCTRCEDGRYWDEDTKACEMCREGCRECTKDGNGGTRCSSCSGGFNFGGAPDCKKCPQENCGFCSMDGQRCSTCFDEGYGFPPMESKPNDCNRKVVNCRNGSHHATGTTVLLGIAAAAAALLF